ncbi:hypothetical protein [Streptomyces sp. NPDC048603]|uniref:hypothetical protein n=1 Tax=Streptomyces sp. NPDC048603 TaxID=3365577 RepID=UPI00371FAAD5
MRNPARLTTASAALACTAALALTGCSAAESGPFAGKSGSEVVNASLDTVRKASSLTFSGTFPDGGKTVHVTMSMTKGGAECTGTFGTEGEGKAELLKKGEDLYLKADEAFYSSEFKDMPKDEAALALKLLAGKWVKSKATDADSKDVAGFCDLGKLTEEFEKSEGAKKGKTGTVNGQEALEITTKTDDGTETVWVATKGEPYLLKTVHTGEEAGEMNFSGFDKPVQVPAPADKDIVDLAKMGG